MPNGIKYSTGAETLALKKNNFYISTGDVDKGPTSNTGYWNGVTPPSGGYTIYVNKVSGGPSIFCPANDTQLIIITNQIAGSNYTTVAQCLDYFAGQSDKMCLNRDYEGIITNGLVLNLDAGFIPSYPTTGTTWYDIGPNILNGTLTNGPTFSSANSGSIVFDGTNDYVDCGNMSSLILSNNQFTANYWVRMAGSNRGDLFSIKNFNTPQDDIGFFIDSNNKLYAYFKVQGVVTNNGVGFGYASISTTTFSRNLIYNITFGKDASQKIFMYVNGALDNNTYSTTTNTATVATTPFWIASNKTGATTPALGWNGNVYNTQIYNRALSATEILQNYNAQKGIFGL
jgi:hypothetical protein